ncbi:MAG: hypothetical protein R3C53_26900 [Pirellulaceae bacterium]
MIFLPILAQTRIEAMNQAFRSPQSGNGYAVMIMIAIVATVFSLAAGIYVYYRRRSERVCHDPRKLFNELCRAHGLNSKQRRLLNNLAQARGVKDPSEVLLDSNHWVLDPTTDKKFCEPKCRNLLLTLQRTLFEVEASRT